jgi:phosphoenolpyruvate-protein phosphotransferase (PTS system enzyme I)
MEPRRITGIPASPGIVVGPVHVLHWDVPEVPQRIIANDQVDAEIRRFHEALGRARERVQRVRDRAEKHAGEEEARIFDLQLLLLQDTELITRVEALIRQNLSAEMGFEVTILEWRHSFSRHTSALMRERLSDITDVQIRVLSLLLGLPDHDPVDLPKGANAILVTDDLTPSLTVQIDRQAIAAIATDTGTRVSHVAILARSLGIPAVVGLKDATRRLRAGEMVILDGDRGTILQQPTLEEMRGARERSTRQVAFIAELELLREAEPVTTDGVRVTLRANVDIPEEAALAAQSGAEGVGLMRTEFLVISRATMPDEEEQYRAYKKVVESFHGAPVVIRTYDIGGDKLPVGGHPHEANPFLGWRAIRMCLDEPDLFLVQLRALLRAAVHGDVQIMLPLVVTVAEVRAARALLGQAAADLVRRGVPHRADVPLGVMIETPASAISADTFVGDVQFFSIGTNDLTQYTLAVDRGNVNLADRFTPLHPSVLRLVQRTVDVGLANGISVTCCGEMASQPVMALALIGLGVRTLSVAPSAVQLMKRLVRGISAADAKRAADEAVASRTAEGAEEALIHYLREAFGAGSEPFDRLPE